MNLKKMSLSMLVLLLAFSGCQKSEDEQQGGSDVFKAGVAEGNVKLVQFDSIMTIFASDHLTQENYAMDVDGDGEADLKIGSYNLFFPEGAKYLEARIERINTRLEVAMTEVIDTIWSCFRLGDTCSMTYYNSVSGFSCNYSNNIYGISKKDYPGIFETGESAETANFRGYSGKMLLCKYDYSSFIDPSPVSNNFLLGIWNGVHEKYLVFRIQHVDHYHYGWLKLSVSDFNKITCTEFAIQQD